ncbi:hypothetical protein Tco_0798783 [Tanacetum coccineum]
MTTLKFAETHNMVAFLSKPTECEGFEQIVDFVNSHPIKYALTVNPTIYASCIEQFWSIVKAKTVNGEVYELQLDDEECMDCLPNATIFEELTRMSSKTTAWNEFSSTMASTIICLDTNQKFNFSKFIFESMVKNLENVSGKFLMYPRFVQVFLEKQLDDMSNHNRIYVTASHTKKIFRNMKRVGKGFSGRVTPLFPTMMVQAQEEMGEGSVNLNDPHHTPTITQPSTSQPQRKQKPRKPKIKDTQIPQSSCPTTNVADEDINEIDDSLERATTTATSLDAYSGSGPRRQETIGDTNAHTRSENISKHSNDPLLARVLALETTKTTQAMEITSLKKRVKKLERRNKSRTHGLKRLYRVGLSRMVESSKDEGLGKEDASKQGRIYDIDAYEDIYLVNVHRDEDMFGVNDLEGDDVVVETKVDHEVVVETEVASRDVNLSVDEVTLAQELAALKIIAASTRPRAKGLVIHEQEQAPPPTISSKDKGKGIMVEEPLKMKKKDQANIDADYQLAQRLQAQEQEELTDAEKARLFIQFLEQSRKHFATKRAEEKRNRPPTKAQQRSIMCTYLKNMEGWKPKSLKSKSFANIHELFDKAFTFVDYKIELVEESSKKAEVMEEISKKAEAEIAQESSSKRAGEALEQESSKNQKLEEDKESEELKQCLEIVPDDGDDVTIDATPLSTKSPTIVDYKIYKEGKKSFFQIIRADVKARFKKTKPVNYMDNFLLLNLKTMFEHHVEDNGRIVGIKSLLEVTAPQVRVTAAKQNLVLFSNLCLYTVNAAGV